MVVEDSFYASKPVFLTSVEIGLAEPRAAKIMQRVSRGLLARKKVAATEEAATEEAAAKSAAAEETAAEERVERDAPRGGILGAQAAPHRVRGARERGVARAEERNERVQQWQREREQCDGRRGSGRGHQ